MDAKKVTLPSGREVTFRVGLAARQAGVFAQTGRPMTDPNTQSDVTLAVICGAVVDWKLTTHYPAPDGYTHVDDIELEDYGELSKAIVEAYVEASAGAEETVAPLAVTGSS
jgi:hypothetical protein